MCFLVFKSEESYKEHLLICNDGKPIVQFKVETKMELGDDLNQLYVCSTCRMIFKSEDLWRNHNQSCIEKRPFVCEENEMTQHTEEHEDTEKA